MFRLLVLLLLAPCLAVALMTAPAPAQAQVQTQPFASDRIIVETRGSGPDVVFIPGLGSTGAAWRATADRLDDRYRVHLVTLRGFGGTAIDGNADGGLAGPAAAEIERYIREQRIERPALIGHSLGGQIALRVAADMGGQVGRVMVVDSSPFFPSLVDSRATSAQVEPLARLGYQALLLFGDQALKSQAATLGVDMGLAGDMVFQGLGLQGGDRRVLAQGLYEALTVDLRPRLAQITAPVTVVYGWTRDRENPRNRLEGLYRYGFQGLRQPPRFERIEGAGHQVMIEQPAAFLAAVRRFLT